MFKERTVVIANKHIQNLECSHHNMCYSLPLKISEILNKVDELLITHRQTEWYD